MKCSDCEKFVQMVILNLVYRDVRDSTPFYVILKTRADVTTAFTQRDVEYIGNVSVMKFNSFKD